MPWLRRIPAGPWIVLGTLFLTAVVYIVRGDSLFSPGPLRDVPTHKASLGGVRSHAALADRCSACHATIESGLTMESLCLGCHTDVRSQIDRRLPLHGRLTDVESCRKCHTEHRGSQATLTDFAHFDHDVTAFPLTGKHQFATCSACHKDQVYKGTPQSCAACHAEPPVHVGRFGTNCAKCHSTVTWKNANLASFNHDLAAFKLTGAHRTTACAACHKDQHFRGTPQSCVACHAEPKVHLRRFGTDCMKCHSTATWKGATITAEFHKFPIFHGGGKNRGECATCHAQPNDYRTYTCYGCHRHEPEKTAEKHLKWNIVELQACAKCHPTGRKRPDQPPKEKALTDNRDKSRP